MANLEEKLIELTEATAEETTIAVKYSPFKALADKGYKLYFGRQIGNNKSKFTRNPFWLKPDGNPQNWHFVVDYYQIFTQETANLLYKYYVSSDTHSDIVHRHYENLRKNIKSLKEHLDEILLMYKTQRIDKKDQALCFSNNEIFRDIKKLAKMADNILNLPELDIKGFMRKYNKLSDFYRAEIKPKYEGIIQTAPPPSQ